MAAFVLLTLLLVLVAVFALQNPDVVTLHFLTWHLQTSVAVLTLAATTVGAMIAGLVGLVARFSRWQRTRAASATSRAASPPSRPRP